MDIYLSNSFSTIVGKALLSSDECTMIMGDCQI